jgi:hypothetical protein
LDVAPPIGTVAPFPNSWPHYVWLRPDLRELTRPASHLPQPPHCGAVRRVLARASAHAVGASHGGLLPIPLQETMRHGSGSEPSTSGT